MNRTDFFVVLLTGLSMLVAGCEKASTAVTTPESKRSRLDARLTEVDLRAAAVGQELRILGLTWQAWRIKRQGIQSWSRWPGNL
jgi:hypothetical protein